MVKNFYANFGFEKISESESGDSDWELATETYKVKKTFIANQIMEL
jgi:hypothetical protein